MEWLYGLYSPHTQLIFSHSHINLLLETPDCNLFGLTASSLFFCFGDGREPVRTESSVSFFKSD